MRGKLLQVNYKWAFVVVVLNKKWRKTKIGMWSTGPNYQGAKAQAITLLKLRHYSLLRVMAARPISVKFAFYYGEPEYPKCFYKYIRLPESPAEL